MGQVLYSSHCFTLTQIEQILLDSKESRSLGGDGRPAGRNLTKPRGLFKLGIYLIIRRRGLGVASREILQIQEQISIIFGAPFCFASLALRAPVRSRALRGCAFCDRAMVTRENNLKKLHLSVSKSLASSEFFRCPLGRTPNGSLPNGSKSFKCGG